MTTINTIILIGRLTRNPELRYTPNGVAVCNFDIAVDRPGEKKETDFIRIIAWQKTAELCANYLGKGRLVGIQGRLQIRSYEAQGGQKRRVAEVVANHMQFLDRAKDESKAPEEPKPGEWDGNLDSLPF